jgi:hypothetical protein
MWYVKSLIDRAQVAFLLWRLHRRRPIDWTAPAARHD